MASLENDPRYIFNVYKQDFVLRNSIDGQYIEYLEKICSSCTEEGQMYDQNKKKCVVKKRFTEIDIQQLELCKKYLAIKKEIPPMNKDLIYKLVQIPIFDTLLSKFINLPFNYLKGNLEKAFIGQFIKFIFENWLKLSKAGILESFLGNIYKVVYPQNKQLWYFITTLISFIYTYYHYIARNNIGVQLQSIAINAWILFSKYKYLILFYQKTALLFLLGSLEFAYKKFITKKTAAKLDTSQINTITSSLSKPGSTTQVRIVTAIHLKKDEDVFDSVPDYDYYTKGGLLYGLFDEKDSFYNKYLQVYSDKQSYPKVNSLKQVVKNDPIQKQLPINQVTNLYSTISKETLELLQKYDIVSPDGKMLFIEQLGLGDLRDPANQLRTITLFKVNPESNVYDTGILYIDNNGKEQIKSIRAVAYKFPIDEVLIYRFKKEVLPYYKIYQQELKYLRSELKRNQTKYNNTLLEAEVGLQEYTRRIRELAEEKKKIQENEKLSASTKRERMNKLKAALRKEVRAKKRLLELATKDFYVQIKTHKNKDTSKIKKDVKKSIDEFNKTCESSGLKKLIKKSKNTGTKLVILDETNASNYKAVADAYEQITKKIETFIDNYSQSFAKSSTEYVKLLEQVKSFNKHVDFSKKTFNDKYKLLLPTEKTNTQGTSTAAQRRLPAVISSTTTTAAQRRLSAGSHPQSSSRISVSLPLFNESTKTETISEPLKSVAVKVKNSEMEQRLLKAFGITE